MYKKDSEKLTIEFACRSDIGLVRTDNQDSYGKFPEDHSDLYSTQGQLFIVADGVGGHADGRIASSMAVEILGRIFTSSRSANKAELMRKSIEEANNRIYSKSSGLVETLRMATTCSALLLKEDTATIGHVGDSKIYKIENNLIERLTTDHTQFQELVNKGILNQTDAANFPSKSILARAVGIEEKLKVDIIENIRLREGQCFILCTDGLGQVTEDEILGIVQINPPDRSCNELISLALERGGKDNVTVMVIKILAGENNIPAGSPGSRSKFINWAFIVMSLIILAIMIFIFIAL